MMSQVAKLWFEPVRAKNMMKCTILCGILSVVTCHAAFAFSSTTLTSGISPLGDRGCTVDYNFDMVGLAVVAIGNRGSGQNPGGEIFLNGAPFSIRPPITEEFLDGCFSEGSVSNLSQNFPSGTFENADYYGFSFEINNQRYEFALVGAEDTQWVAKIESVGSPPTELQAEADQVRRVVVDEAVRSLQSTIAANQRMTRDARDRFIAVQGNDDGGNEPGNVAFDVNGTLDASGTTISTKGTFFGAESTGDGSQRLVFGDVDVQHDGETGSSTATLTGRMAWEQMISEQTMLGYFVGGELAHSNISGAFSGDQNRVGVTFGGYAVHELAKNTYVDGFVTFGAGRNNLEMANDVLALESDYTTRSVTFGGALSSVIEQSGYEIRPEMSFSYGRTWIGDVGFTGSAYGLVDNTLSLDAGSVALANIMFRPEFRVPLEGHSAADSLQLFTFAPRLICEQIKTTVTENNCGGGAEIGFTGQFSGGLSTYFAKISADRLGNRTTSSLQLNLEHRF